MPRATGEPGAEQGPGHKLQQPGQLPLPARFQQPQLIPPPNAALCPASRSTLPLGFGELRSPLPKTAQTPHHGVRSAAETRSCNMNPSSHAFSAAWLPVTLQSNTSPRLQERGVSRGGGQWGGGVPPTNPVGEGGPGRPQAAEGCVAALLARTRKQRIDEGDGSQHALRWAIFSTAGRAGVWEPKSEFISICECSSREDEERTAQVQQIPPGLFWDWLTLASAPLRCTPCPSPLQCPVGTVPPPRVLEL